MKKIDLFNLRKILILSAFKDILIKLSKLKKIKIYKLKILNIINLKLKIGTWLLILNHFKLELKK